jgi:hypothetical protein
VVVCMYVINESMAFSNLKDLISVPASKRNLTNRLLNAHVFEIFRLYIKEHFGAQFLNLTRPQSIKQGVLWVCVADSVLAQELHQHSVAILEEIGEVVPGAGVKGIRIIQEALLESTLEE